MSLFKLADVTVKTKNINSPVIESGVDEIVFCPGENTKDIYPLISTLQEGSSIYFMTDGAWSNIDIINDIISLIGPCSMDFCTWSISADAIRKFTHWQETGNLDQINVLLDQGLRNRKPEIFQQAAAAFKNLKLIKCHAKVAVLQNEEFHFVVVGSANFTNNPRKEAGMIIRNRNIAAANTEWIRKELNYV